MLLINIETTEIGGISLNEMPPPFHLRNGNMTLGKRYSLDIFAFHPTSSHFSPPFLTGYLHLQFNGERVEEFIK